MDFITNEQENKIFERKSAQVSISELAKTISGFANADGGTIVIGISDATRAIEGINGLSEEKINNLINAPKDGCKPMPKYDYEYLEAFNKTGAEDRLLLLHIYPSTNSLVRTNNDETYLRIGDRTREIRGEDLINHKDSKETRRYEEECNYTASIKDLDEDLLIKYAEIIGANGISFEQLLRARGFIKDKNGTPFLTNAAVLLFAKNILQFYPNCRIRFLRYAGSKIQVGTNINIIKDISFDDSILRIIDKAKNYIATQLREFTVLDNKTGQFQTLPEYPEFAWQEAIVNAVTHREYAYEGSYIRINMFDDRLEIESPGSLPNIVTISNIKETRYSRNPKISRVLTEFGWVRELNEGVKRIYEEMDSFFLDAPEYSEPNNSVKLVLKNNILARHSRQVDNLESILGNKQWESMDYIEKSITTYLYNKGASKRSELEKYTHKSDKTVLKRLRNLIAKGIIRANGKENDPNRTYAIILTD